MMCTIMLVNQLGIAVNMRKLPDEAASSSSSSSVASVVVSLLVTASFSG